MHILPRALRTKLFTLEGIICCAMLVIGGVVGLRWAVRTPVFAMATTVQPQSFTELYFADVQQVPERVQADKTYNIRFVIANHTGSDRQYAYTVSVQSVSSIKHEPPVSVRIAAGERGEQQYALQSPVPGEPLVFTVTLDTNEVIRFYARP